MSVRSFAAAAWVGTVAASAVSSFAGPMIDPLPPTSAVSPDAAAAAVASVPAASLSFETIDTRQLGAAASGFAALPTTDDAQMVVPEIPLPPVLIPMAAGLIYVGRKVMGGRLSRGR